jgi:hypothetical protein
MSDIIYTPPVTGGSGNISGTLTPTYVPYASGSNNISDSNIYFDVANNRIGINNNTPAYTLDITGETIQTSRIFSDSNDTRLYLHNAITGNANNNGLLIGMISNDVFFYNYQAGNTIFGSNAIERMRINSVGNVGIGTTAPSEKLAVNGNIALPKTGNTFIYNDQSGSDSVTIGGAQYFSVKTFNGTNYVEVLRATASGFVGIGTTAPSRELEVNGLIVTNRTSNADGALIFGSGGARYFYSPDSGGYIATYTGAIERMIVTSGGLIGIGTSSPVASAQLQVASPLNNTGFLCPQLTNAQILAISSPAEGLMVYNTTISHICFYQGGAWVRINHSPM